MNILFTICGRAGSKGIRNKNIRPFNGKYLPYYSISAIDLLLKKFDQYDACTIVVSSDSEELLGIMQNNGMRMVEIINRSSDLSGDAVAKIEVIRDCYLQMKARMGMDYDIVVDLDITSPLRTKMDLKNVIDKHLESGADVTTTVTLARRNPYFNQLMKCEKGYKKVISSDFTARQQAPQIFDMNASIYAYNPRYLEAGKGVLEGYCECVEMYDTGILDLDHENDFELMEVIAGYLFDNNNEFKEIYENIC